jgi:hypothetical protein
MMFFALCLYGTAAVFAPAGVIAADTESRVQIWDTQWILPVDTGQYVDADIDLYFAKRREQGFDVIMTGATQFALRNDSRSLNGAFPFRRQFIYPLEPPALAPVGDIADPDPAAWDYVGGLIDRAGKAGLKIALLPMANGGSKPYTASLQNEGTAFSFGRWLGKRLADKSNLIWVLGGDVCVIDQALVDRTAALARGIRAAGAKQPITAHFGGIGSDDSCNTSGAAFAGEDWFDFSMVQSTVPREEEIDAYINADRRRGLPTGTGETVYEDAVYANGLIGTPHNIRHRFFRTVFNGGFYFAYGHGQVMLGCLTDSCLKYGDGSLSGLRYIAAAKDFLNLRGMRRYEKDRSFVSSASRTVLPVSLGSSKMVYLGINSSALLNLEPSIVRIYDLPNDPAYANPLVQRTDGDPVMLTTIGMADDALVTIDPVIGPATP